MANPGESLVLEDLVDKLLNQSISVYDMVDYCKKHQEIATPALKELVSKHESPYVRLCSAWSLGEIADKSAIPILKEAYGTEDEVNARANMAWAQFMIDPHHIDEDQFDAFLLDKYYVIPLIALKRFSGLHDLQGKYDFLKYYSYHENILVRSELLRNIKSFTHATDINDTLRHELYTTEEPLLKSELINAIGATNHIDSVDILMDYYSEFKDEIANNETLAYSIVNAMLFLSQSRPYKILHEMYHTQKSKLVRWRIIETLASAGGPNSLTILKEINKSEADAELKSISQKFIALTKVTTNYEV
ncbi:MAG: HEAT repeat domain-containing protein [Patescibacteria group bacterium]